MSTVPSKDLQLQLQKTEDEAKEGSSIEKVPDDVPSGSNGSGGAARSVGLTDLPPELLLCIMGKMNSADLLTMRQTSKFCLNATNNYVMHHFKKMLHQYERLAPDSIKNITRKVHFAVMRIATEVFTSAGFESAFCGSFLHILETVSRNPDPSAVQVKNFIQHLYEVIHNSLGKSQSQRSSLLYCLTVIRILKEFDGAVIRSTVDAVKWRFMVEIKSPWLGILWIDEPPIYSQHENRLFMLGMVSVLLISSLTRKYSKEHDESVGNHVVTFVGEYEKVIPKTTFTVTVIAAKKMLGLFKHSLDAPLGEFVWPEDVPSYPFYFMFDIECLEARRWGCSAHQHLEFGSPDLKLKM